MKTIAYCAQSFAPSVAKAAGVKPITCPPETWRPTESRHLPGAGRLPGGVDLQSADLLYLKLHGLKDEPYLYGDEWITALHTDALYGLDLSRLVVFSTCCHFLDTPWPQALAARGCRHIIAGHGTNWARANAIAGADRLGRLFRLFLTASMTPPNALQLAKFCLQHSRDQATRDALAFHLWGTCELPADGPAGPNETPGRNT